MFRSGWWVLWLWIRWVLAHDVDPDEAETAATIALDPARTDCSRRNLLAVAREMQRGQDENDGEHAEPEVGSGDVAGVASPDCITPGAGEGFP